MTSIRFWGTRDFSFMLLPGMSPFCRCMSLSVCSKATQAFCRQSGRAALSTKPPSNVSFILCLGDGSETLCCVAVLEQHVTELFGLKHFHVHGVLAHVMRLMEFFMFRFNMKWGVRGVSGCGTSTGLPPIVWVIPQYSNYP